MPKLSKSDQRQGPRGAFLTTALAVSRRIVLSAVVAVKKRGRATMERMEQRNEILELMGHLFVSYSMADEAVTELAAFLLQCRDIEIAREITKGLELARKIERAKWLLNRYAVPGGGRNGCGTAAFARSDQSNIFAPE